MATKLEQADKEFAALGQRRRELLREDEGLRQEVARLQASDQHGPKLTEVGKKLQAVQDELIQINPEFKEARRRAGRAAALALGSDGAYRKQIKAVALAWVRLVGPWAELIATIDALKAEGVHLPMPPPSVAEVEAARHWLQRQIADGILDAKLLPAARGSLMEEDER